MAIDKTVQAVFDKAIYLIDAQNDSTGATRTGDTRDYEVRTLDILNSKIDDIFPYSSNYSIGEDGKRPALGDLASFSDEIDMDEVCVRTLLPLALAAELIRVENESNAKVFLQQLEEAELKAEKHRPAFIADVEDMYGGIEYGGFSRWG